jgi:hypothetical protein
MAKKSKKPVAKKVSTPAASQSPVEISKPDTPRKLKLPHYKSFQLQKRIKSDKAIPSVYALFKTAFGVLRNYWVVFLGISLIYGLLNVFLVQGFSVASDLGQVKESIAQGFGGNIRELATGFSTFMYLLGTSGSQLSPTAGAYQFLLTLIASLALIWAFRQAYAGIKVRIRDAFYRGMYPLVPFVLVLMVVGLQLLPFVGGFALYTTVMKNGIAVGVAETTLWATVFILLSVLTLYLLCSSLFALYIACLPDMTPMRALRSAREVVRFRRLTILRKLIFLPIVLFLLAAVIMIPLIMFVAWLAPWAFFLMSMLFLAAIHSYIYTLYRSLL